MADEPFIRKHVMFVEHDPKTLTNLQRLLHNEEHRWRLTFMQSPEQAIAACEHESFDVIVADLQMPQMNGLLFLQHIKKKWPAVVRILHAEKANEQAVSQSLTIAHQYLDKPCRYDDLQNTLERACTLAELVANENLRQVIGNIDRIPSLPESYWQLMRVLERDNYDASEVAAVIERDTAMTAAILQLANSSFFGAIQPVASIEHALTFLGTDSFRTIAQSAYMFAQLPQKANAAKGFSYAKLQRYALIVAKLAHQMLNEPQSGRAGFTAGLMHDIGKLIIATWMGPQFELIQKTMVSTQQPEHLVEQSILGATHAQMGAYLLALWGLPNSIVQAVLYQHDPWDKPQPKGFSVRAAVRIAVQVVEEVSKDTDQATFSFPDGMLHYLKIVGLSSRLPLWIEICKQDIKKIQML